MRTGIFTNVVSAKTRRALFLQTAAFSALYLLHAYFPTTTRTLFHTFAPLAIAYFVLASAALPPVPAATRTGRALQILKSATPAVALCAVFFICAERFIFAP